ncbi:MAG: DNA-binding transcriptional regulator [Lentisphaeraceae bacterium]|nr:DNA-binding transcriptional regulator [Lentisphaeraceae bacterium]
MTSLPMKNGRRHVTLMVNMNKAYERRVVKGVARYLKENTNWSLYVESDPLGKKTDLNDWSGDGIIANLDDPEIYDMVKKLSIPVVGFASRQLDIDMPYINCDANSVAELAAEHFIERGFRRFAYYGSASDSSDDWSQKLCTSFTQVIEEQSYQCSPYQGDCESPQKWQINLPDLMKWLQTLELPCALLAATDSQARHVLEACTQVGIKVPEELAVIGVDNDEMSCDLAIPPLTSINQGSDKLGYETACMLDVMMNGEEVASSYAIQAQGLIVRQSTDVLAIEDPLLKQALAFISQEAGNSILVDDVCKFCNISRATLENKFKTILERSVHAEIGRMKLKKVEELLIHSDLPLKRIAHVTGFSTVQYMSSKLKASSGLTLQEFRQKSR